MVRIVLRVRTAAPTRARTRCTSRLRRRRAAVSRLRSDASSARRRRWEARTVRWCRAATTRFQTQEVVRHHTLYSNNNNNSNNNDDDDPIYTAPFSTFQRHWEASRLGALTAVSKRLFQIKIKSYLILATCMLAVVRRYSMMTSRYRCCSHFGYGDGCTGR